jgi:uncharacterized protein (DUF983 family)
MPETTFPTPRSWVKAFRNGFACRCPNCGDGALYSGYLTVAVECGVCGTELHHHRADDAPPYFTIFLVGHVVMPLLLAVEKIWAPELWIHFSLWLPLTLGLTLLLLPRIKGAVVGLQWAFGMHGFAPDAPNFHTP